MADPAVQPMPWEQPAQPVATQPTPAPVSAPPPQNYPLLPQGYQVMPDGTVMPPIAAVVPPALPPGQQGYVPPPAPAPAPAKKEAPVTLTAENMKALGQLMNDGGQQNQRAAPGAPAAPHNSVGQMQGVSVGQGGTSKARPTLAQLLYGRG
jgi:hypothetical protein